MVGTGKRLNEFSDDMQQCSSQSEGQSNGCATEPVRLCTRNQDNQKKPQPIDTAPQAMSSDRSLSPQSVLVPSQANQSQTPLTTATVLDHCLNLLATPLIDQEMRRWTLEDPDLMPSIEDWLLVWRVSTQHGTVRPIHFSFDGEAFLKSFFFMPPVLRLTMCAVTAYYAGLPEDSIFNYYQRAKKAFLRIEQSKPTYQTIQSLFNIFLFGPAYGQPSVLHQLLQIATNMIIQLRIDVDPDDSPWLFHLNLTPRQKEDRRRAFWGVYWVLKHEQATSDTITVTTTATMTSPLNLNNARMKPPNEINDPYPIFGINAGFIPTISLLEVMAAIRQHHLKAPTTKRGERGGGGGGIQQIFASETTSSLNTFLLTVHASIPLNYILISKTAHLLTRQDSLRFTTQLDALPVIEAFSSMVLSLLLPTSICILYRPKLYLTGIYLSSSSSSSSSSSASCKPSQLSPSRLNILDTAVTQSLEAAARIVTLYSFILEVWESAGDEPVAAAASSAAARIGDTTGDDDNEDDDKTRKGRSPLPPAPQQPPPRPLPRWFHPTPNITCFYSLFEAAIVIWFISCRMAPEWRARLQMLQRRPKQDNKDDLNDYLNGAGDGEGEEVKTGGGGGLGIEELQSKLVYIIGFMKNAIVDAKLMGGAGGSSSVYAPLVRYLDSMCQEMTLGLKPHCHEADDHGTKTNSTKEERVNNRSTTTNTATTTANSTSSTQLDRQIKVKAAATSNTSEEVKPASNDRPPAPHAFLGFLGLELMCGSRWTGEGDESWRLFWRNLNVDDDGHEQ